MSLKMTEAIAQIQNHRSLLVVAEAFITIMVRLANGGRSQIGVGFGIGSRGRPLSIRFF